MVSGPGSSQARFERGRSRPTSSITIATSGLLLRSRNGSALRRQVCSRRHRSRSDLLRPRLLLDVSARLAGLGLGVFRQVRECPRCARISAAAVGAGAGALRFMSSIVSRAILSRSAASSRRRSSSHRRGRRRTAASKPMTMECQRWACDPCNERVEAGTQALRSRPAAFGLLLFAFPLLFFLDAISAISPKPLPCRHYSASMRIASKQTLQTASDFTTRDVGVRPSGRFRGGSRRRLLRSSILRFSRSTWPITRFTPRDLP